MQKFFRKSNEIYINITFFPQNNYDYFDVSFPVGCKIWNKQKLNKIQNLLKYKFFIRTIILKKEV